MVEGPGLEVRDNVVPSPKRLLSQPGEVIVAGEAMDPEDIVGVVLRAIREHARQVQGADEIDRVVMTVPVSMDGRARKRLRQAALRQGIEITQFVHEPLAALYGSLRSHDEREFSLRLADLADGLFLVVDWGGGTLDLTLCTYADGMLMQIQNRGDDQVGGDLFDEALMNLVVKKHIEAHGLTADVPLVPGARQKIRTRCEMAKIRLSSRSEATIVLDDCFDVAGSGPGSPRRLNVVVTRDEFDAAVDRLVAQGVGAIDALLLAARRDAASVRRCLLVGGMANVPEIRERIAGIFDASRIEAPPRGDRLIAEGAAWIAHDRVRLGLPKPFEIRLARGTCAEIAPRETLLPLGGAISKPFTIQLFCADPRDGTAILEFVRPVWPGRSALGDERAPYALVRLPVDAGADPLTERLDVSVRFTEDLIATIHATATGSGATAAAEIHDLEFGLRPNLAPSDESGIGGLEEERATELPVAAGDVVIRNNVMRATDRLAIPGDLFREHGKDVDMTPEQRREALYYQPCSACGLTMFEVRAAGGCGVKGCDQTALS